MKTLLITGASTGIGAAAAVHFAKQGHRVFAGVRKTTDADHLQQQNSAITPLILDVTKPEQIQQALKVVEEGIQGELCLINNAGIAVAGPTEFVDIEEYRRQFEVNFFGLVAVTQTFLPLLRKTRGRVVSISSIAGRVASPFLGPYSASKFAVEAVSDSLRREVEPLGVKVILIEPGPIQTPIWEKGLSAKETLVAGDKDQMMAVYGKQLQNFVEYITASKKTASPIIKVLEAMDHALTSSSPKHRYLVGKESGIVAFVPVIPSRLVDKIISFKLSRS
ncbi:MAG: SDR family oxidoreductase [Bdellovibrionales bacterium]|nr:SDR family oxidoreductase [Bdellovibrionales bacterium]